MAETRCGICNHAILDLHYCGDCVDELRSALAAATKRAEEAEEARDVARQERDAARADRDQFRRERDALAAKLAESEEEARRLHVHNHELIAEVETRSVPCSQCGKETGSMGRRLTAEIGLRQHTESRLAEAVAVLRGATDLLRSARRYHDAKSPMGCALDSFLATLAPETKDRYEETERGEIDDDGCFAPETKEENRG